MRPPTEWQESDLQSLIDNQVEENINLDYKAAAALAKTDGRKADISKDVSSFANSEGGVLVYGMAEDGRLSVRIDPIDPSIISREWLEQVINSNIQRRIDGVRINPVALTGPNSGKVVFVVDVPQSPLAPHQAADKKYYKRFNFQSVAMEDYEIRDVANRRRNPIIKADISIEPLNGRAPSYSATLSLILKNVGGVLADRVYLELAIPNDAVGRTKIFSPKDIERKKINGWDYQIFKYVHRDGSGLLPIFPGATVQVLDGNALYLNLALQQGNWFELHSHLPVECTVFADHADPQKESVTLANLIPEDARHLFPEIPFLHFHGG